MDERKTMKEENRPFGRRTVLKTIGGSVIFGGAASGVVSAQTAITVPDDYSSIQAAINHAAAGDVIFIKNGTYEESLLVYTDDLTIRGESKGGVIVDASNETGRGIEAQAPGLTFESFTLIGTDDSSAGYGLKLEPGSDNASVSEVTVNDSRRTGIDLHGLTGATLEDVHVEGTDSGNGIALTDCHDVHVTAASTTENGWGGCALYTSGAFVDAGLSNITVENSTFFGEPAGLYAQDSGGTGPTGFSDLTVSNNKFTDNFIGVLNQGGHLEVRDSVFEIPEEVSGQRRQIYFFDGGVGQIVGNEVQGNHRVGILLDGTGTSATVNDNEVTGTGPRTDGWAENGIQVSRGASATILRNTVEGHWWNYNDFVSSGIIIFGSEDVSVQHNTIKNNDLSVALFGDNNNALHNTIDVDIAPTVPDDDRKDRGGGATGDEVLHYGVMVSGDNNGVRQNSITATDGEVGIYIYNGSDRTKLIRNILEGWDEGIDDQGDETKLPRPFDPEE